MKHEIAQMQKQGGGAIVNLCSISGLNGIPYANTYVSTKPAVVGFTKSCALDHAAENIRINGVARAQPAPKSSPNRFQKRMKTSTRKPWKLCIQ